MSWDVFVWFALSAVLCWALGAFFAWKDRRTPTLVLTLLGLLIYAAFITGFWISLDRPPLRT